MYNCLLTTIHFYGRLEVQPRGQGVQQERTPPPHRKTGPERKHGHDHAAAGRVHEEFHHVR